MFFFPIHFTVKMVHFRGEFVIVYREDGRQLGHLNLTEVAILHLQQYSPINIFRLVKVLETEKKSNNTKSKPICIDSKQNIQPTDPSLIQSIPCFEEPCKHLVELLHCLVIWAEGLHLQRILCIWQPLKFFFPFIPLFSPQ